MFELGIHSQCPTCHAIFTRQSNMQQHRMSHKSYTPFKCHVCSSFFLRRALLQRHKIRHTGKKGYNWKTHHSYAYSSSSKNISLHQNRKQHLTLLKQSSFSCGESDLKHDNQTKQTQLQYTELQHAKASQDLRPFSCKICHFAFRKNKELKRHELIHSIVKQYRCPKCSASFKTKPYLYYHQYRVECGSGQFKCAECPAAFLWQSSLSRH